MRGSLAIEMTSSGVLMLARTETGTIFGACEKTTAAYGWPPPAPPFLCETITMHLAGREHRVCRWCGKAGW